MDHADELVFDARGLIHHEARLQADVRVTTIPAGMDPDEVVLRDPEEWRAILAAAQPIVIHVMETLARSRNVDDPKAKSEIAAQVLPLIEDVPNAVEREDYRQRLARLLRVDERALSGGGSGPARTARPARSGRRPTSAGETRRPAALISTQGKAFDLEAFCLSLLLRQPDALYLLDRSLLNAGLGRLSEQDFEHADHQLLARLIFQSLEQDDHEPIQYIRQNANGSSVTSLIDDLLKPFEKGEPNPDKLREELVRTVFSLRMDHIYRDLEQLRFQQEDFQEQGDMSQGLYDESVVRLIIWRDKLDRALGKPLQFE